MCVCVFNVQKNRVIELVSASTDNNTTENQSVPGSVKGICFFPAGFEYLGSCYVKVLL